MWCNIIWHLRSIWQATLCPTNIFNEASVQSKCKRCSHEHISCDWIVFCVLPSRRRIPMPNKANVGYNRLPNSFASKLQHGNKLRDPRPSPSICYDWRDKSSNTFQYMQLTYCVAPLSDHWHISYGYAYNTLLNTHAQTAPPDWNYNDTAFLIKICLW